MTQRKTPLIPLETPVGKVYNFVLRSGLAGLTDEELYNGLSNEISSERRLRDHRQSLVEEGLIVNTGTRMTSNNRPAKIWKTTAVVEKMANR